MPPKHEKKSKEKLLHGLHRGHPEFDMGDAIFEIYEQVTALPDVRERLKTAVLLSLDLSDKLTTLPADVQVASIDAMRQNVNSGVWLDMVLLGY